MPKNLSQMSNRSKTTKPNPPIRKHEITINNKNRKKKKTQNYTALLNVYWTLKFQHLNPLSNVVTYCQPNVLASDHDNNRQLEGKQLYN